MSLKSHLILSVLYMLYNPFKLGLRWSTTCEQYKAGSFNQTFLAQLCLIVPHHKFFFVCFYSFQNINPLTQLHG